MKVVTDIVSIPDQAFTLHMELMSVLRSTEGEQVLLVLIYQPPVANQQEIRLLELTVRLEQLHIDQYNTIVLGDFNLDQMHHITLKLTCLKIFLLALLLPSVQIILQVSMDKYYILSSTIENRHR